MIKKVLICVVLVLLAFSMIIPVLAVRDSFETIYVPKKDVQSDEQSDAKGYTLSFGEKFFEGLAELEEGDFKVVMYVDGKRVDTMPAGGSMQAHVVEFFCDDCVEKQEHLMMETSGPDENVRAYGVTWDGEVDSMQWQEFDTPVCIVLLGDYTLESIGFWVV